MSEREQDISRRLEQAISHSFEQSIRTDAEIVAKSEAALRWEMSEEGELKRALWAAREDINRLEAEVKRLAQQVAEQKGSMARTREVIRKVCHRLADPYDHLHDGLWVDGGLSLQDLVENIVQRLTQQVKDEKYRTAKAREDAACLAIDVKNAYREIEKLKGGE
jgi:hypothetical protein